MGLIHRIIRKDLTCSPCRNKNCQERRCLTGIAVDEVLREVIELYEKIKGELNACIVYLSKP